MTCIAWNGQQLAVDRRAVCDNIVRTVSKSRYIVGLGVFAFTGDFHEGQELMEWGIAGADPDNFPAGARESSQSTSLLLADCSGKLHQWLLRPCRVTWPNQLIAFGSGRDFAVAAMHLGRDAHEGVQVACRFDAWCGNGIDVYDFDGASYCHRRYHCDTP